MKAQAAPVRLTLDLLNACDAERFVQHAAPIWEHAPWVAEAVVSQRPFASVQALHDAMLAVVGALPEPALVQFFAGHPELAGDAARRGLMTAESVAEQGQLGLAQVDAQEQAAWDDLNLRYRQRFGFPFILCVRRHTRASALEAFARRMQGNRADELRHNLLEIAAITRLRLDDLLQHDA